MKPTQGWGAVGAVLLAVALFSLNRGHGRVCTKRDMCREDEDGTMRCNWRRCPGCAVVVHSDHGTGLGEWRGELEKWHTRLGEVRVTMNAPPSSCKSTMHLSLLWI